MEKRKLLKVTFDPQTHEKQIQETDQMKAGPPDVFACLAILSHLMPEVAFMERWQTKEVGPKQPRYHGNYHELVFILDGNGAYEIDGKLFAVSKKDVVVIRPNEVHRYTDESDFECISLHFTLDRLWDLKKQIKKRKPRSVPEDEFLEFLVDHYPNIHTISLVEGSQIINLATQLFREYSSPGAGSSLIVSLSFIQVLILLARNYLYAKKGDGLVNNQASTRDEIMVRQITRYINENYGRQIEPAELFTNYYLHPNHCRFIFKKITGTSVSAYLLQKRMQEAKVLVVDTNLTLEEIAGRVGIEDYFYFLRAFKKAHGISPGAMRKAPSH